MILVLLWDDDVFVIRSAPDLWLEGKNAQLERKGFDSPAMGSLAGSIRLDKQTGRTLRDLVAADDLNVRLQSLAESARSPGNTLRHRGQVLDLSVIGADLETTGSKSQPTKQDRNLQVILLKWISQADGRCIKYLWLYVMFGIAYSPFHFIFLTLEEATKERGNSFSDLAGTVIVSQAAIESIAFYIMPWLSQIASQTSLLVFGMIILVLRNLFYGYFYYTSEISLYWAVVAEWGHGIPYSIYCSLQAEIALMFANQCARFIPKLIELGILSNPVHVSRDTAKREEESIKVLLRATMNAIFSGASDGLGQGVGCLVCGLVYDYFGYVNLWRMMLYITIATLVVHLVVEASRSHYSDSNSKYKRHSSEVALSELCHNDTVVSQVDKSSPTV